MSNASLPKVTIFTDGGCEPNPGLGGWAAIISATVNGQPVERLVKGAIAHANNQRMELTAAAEALESLTRPCAVTLFSDSQYVVKGMTEWIATWLDNGWMTSKRRPVKHDDLWKRLVAQTKRHTVTFKWVKAETLSADEQAMVARVDDLVRQARQEFAEPVDDDAAPVDDSQPETAPDKPYRLMIAGSRRTSANMLEFARRVVARTIEHGWEIVVGDNPAGVDAAIVQECIRCRYAHVVVVGIATKPRNGGVQNGRYIRIGKSYAERDRLMAKASDRGLFIWDGQSSGTQQGYRFVRSLGKQAHLVSFASTFVS